MYSPPGAPEGLLQVGRSSGIPSADPLQMIWLDNVLCSDSDQSIADCSHLQWGNTNCDHSQDVALKCSGMLMPQSCFALGPVFHCGAESLMNLLMHI